MEITVKIKEAEQLVGPLDELLAIDNLPLDISYRAGKIYRLMKEDLEEYQTRVNEWIKKLGAEVDLDEEVLTNKQILGRDLTEDESDQVRQAWAGKWRVLPENMEEFQSQVTVAEKEEIIMTGVKKPVININELKETITGKGKVIAALESILEIID